MTTKNDCICSNPKCRADLKKVGITMVKKLYRTVTFQDGDWDFGNNVGIYFLAYCKGCKSEIKDKSVLKQLKEGWLEVAHS